MKRIPAFVRQVEHNLAAYIALAIRNNKETSSMRYPKLLALFLFLMSIGVPKIQSQDSVETKKLTKIRQQDGMKMVYIPAGTFIMGDETGDLDGTEDGSVVANGQFPTIFN